MRMIKPDAKYLDPGKSVTKFIELCGRTCYKSEDKISEGTDKAFFEKMVANGHHAMLEHAYLYGKAINSNYQKIMRGNRFINFEGVNGFFSMSMRVAVELSQSKSEDIYQERFYREMERALNAAIDGEFYSSSDIIMMSRDAFIVEVHYPSYLHNLIPHTVLFTVDRGVTHELVRHRIASFAQESTRYCNYSKGKYGSEITVIEPEDWETKTDAEKELITSHLEDVESLYIKLTQECNWPAQRARMILPQCTKADIIVTAIEDEWFHILDLRLFAKTGASHPDMKRVMKIVYPSLKKNFILEYKE